MLLPDVFSGVAPAPAPAPAPVAADSRMGKGRRAARGGARGAASSGLRAGEWMVTRVAAGAQLGENAGALRIVRAGGEPLRIRTARWRQPLRLRRRRVAFVALGAGPVAQTPMHRVVNSEMARMPNFKIFTSSSRPSPDVSGFSPSFLLLKCSISPSLPPPFRPTYPMFLSLTLAPTSALQCHVRRATCAPS